VRRGQRRRNLRLAVKSVQKRALAFVALAPVDPEIDENSPSEEADEFSREEHNREQNVRFSVDV
jgi:hypothetical protein